MFIAVVTLLVAPFNYRNRPAFFIYRAMARGLLFIGGVKIKSVKGLEKLNKDEAYLFLANHCSYVDIPILMSVIPNNVRFIYKKSMTMLPIFGWAMWAAKYVPIDRSNGREALKSLRRAARFMKQGLSIAIFPEGTRSLDGKTAEFKKGMTVIADEAKCKIVPVSISGTFKILPKNSLMINKGEVRVVFGQPVEFSKEKGFLKEIKEKIEEQITNNK